MISSFEIAVNSANDHYCPAVLNFTRICFDRIPVLIVAFEI